MKIKVCFIFFILIFILGFLLFIPGDVRALYYGAYVPGEILVKIDNDFSVQNKESLLTTGISEIDLLNKKFSVTSINPIYPPIPGKLSSKSTDLSRVYKVNFSPKIDVMEVVNAYSALSGVEYAQPNYLLYESKIPSDPNYPNQSPYLDVMNVAKGWDVETGSPSVVVAVIDSGVAWKHPDLAANIWNNTKEIPDNGIDDDHNGFIDDNRGWDFVSISSDSVYTGEDPAPPDNNPDDFAGHGTFVSTQVAAVGNNGIGIVGMTWNCKIMPVRAGYEPSGGGGASFSTSDVAAAINYAADNGANVINMSFGTQGDPSAFPAITDAVNNALAKGVVIVAAAGNSDLSSSDFPANIPGVISSGSVNIDGSKSSFSNFGSQVPVYAIGNQVFGSFPLGPHSQTGATPFKTGYAIASGTSFSTPLTSGLAALIISENPTLSKDQVVSQIVNFADTTSSGLKRINVYRSLTEGVLANTLSYTLSPGWNLISFPFLSVTSMNGFSGPFYYDEGRGDAQIQKITDFTQLAPGKAYWVFADSAVTFTTGGVALSTDSFTRPLTPEGFIPIGNPFTASSGIPWDKTNVTLGNGQNLLISESQGILASTIYYYDTSNQKFVPVQYTKGNLSRETGYYILNRAATDILFKR